MRLLIALTLLISISASAQMDPDAYRAAQDSKKLDDGRKPLDSTLVKDIYKNMREADTTTVDRYCLVLAIGKFMSTKVVISIDYGEERKFWSTKDRRMRDEEGKIKNFNTVIDALNFMANQGWKLHSTLLLGSQQLVYHYVFKKTYLRSDFLPEATQ